VLWYLSIGSDEALAFQTGAVGAWMIVWWVTEAIPIAATALMPVVLFPLLGISDLSQATAPYAKEYVFLFLGGFLIALALEKHNLHRWIALNIMSRVGSSPRKVMLGVIVATALLSMWISNTATAVMMLPIAATAGRIVSDAMPGRARGFSAALLLSVAYSANIGGCATLIGTPPNIVMAGYLDSAHGVVVSFSDWLAVGVPFSMVMLVLMYFFMSYGLYRIPGAKVPELAELVKCERESIGSLTGVQKRVMAVFLLTCLLWVAREPLDLFLPQLRLSDPVIGMMGGLLMFFIPAGKFGRDALIDWGDTTRLPWGIILLFGGGLSLAAALDRAGIIHRIGNLFSEMGSDELVLLVLLLTATSLFITEVMSNLALVSVFVPVVAGIGISAGLPPETLSIPITLAASCAFMLPMATPPNAIVFATGELKIHQMARGGIVLNLLAVLVIWAMWHFGLLTV
jgi:solute carrier family 13 (sodium-dependent dicarboxylate transporter), member 2/3/5